MTRSLDLRQFTLASALAAALASAGCTVTRVNDEVVLPVPDRWENADASVRPIGREDLAQWWTGARSPGGSRGRPVTAVSDPKPRRERQPQQGPYSPGADRGYRKRRARRLLGNRPFRRQSSRGRGGIGSGAGRGGGAAGGARRLARGPRPKLPRASRRAAADRDSRSEHRRAAGNPPPRSGTLSFGVGDRF